MPINPDYINSFESFLETWLVRQRNYVNQLRILSSQIDREQEVGDLVGEVLVHYKLYYDVKGRFAREEDVFTLFSPPWFNTLERSFLWVAGFKPGLAFKVVERLVGNELTANQLLEFNRLRAQTRSNEKTLSNEMTRIQESLAGPSWVEMVMGMGRQQLNGEMDGVAERTKKELIELVENADYLRTQTAKELVFILNPFQAARFLTAMGQLQLNIRSCGQQKDAERMNGNELNNLSSLF